MARKLSALLLTLFSLIAGVNAQSGTGGIKGNIVTSEGEPAAFVSVRIEQHSRGTVTDGKGDFAFRRLEPGTYVLQVSLLGYEPMAETVTVTAGQTATVKLHLQVSKTQLSEVTVVGGQNKLANKESDYIARLPIKNLENPQVYNVIGKELMKEQVITSFDDALKNAPGVTRLWSSTGRGGDGAGYFTMRGFAVQPTMVNGIAGISNGSPDPADIERVETIKGPSGTLFGSSLVSFGGLINIVTKKPYDAFGGEISYTGGTYGLNRVTADLNTPLNKDKSVILRTNAAYHSEGSFQDAGFKRSWFLAPSLSYRVNDRLSFLVNTEFYSGEGTNPTMIFLNRRRQLIARTPDQLGIDFTRSFTSNDIVIKTPSVNLFGQANYKISDQWTSQTTVSRSTRRSQGYYSYVMFLDEGGTRDNPMPANDTLISRYLARQNSTTTATDVQQNFIGDFKIGSLRNRLVAGLDFLSQFTENDNSPYIRFDLINTVNPKDPRYSQLNKAAVDARLAQATTGQVRNATTNYTYSAYVSDVLNITDQLIAMASLRVDHFVTKPTKNYVTGEKGKDDFSQTSVSPKFGLIYQVVKDKVSLFANYMNGFKNSAPVTQSLPEYSGVLKPQQANQFEGGVKLNVLNNKLSMSASYYNILVTNMTRSIDVEKDGNHYNITVQDGSQRSKGVEVDLIANPLPGLNIVAGYGYNDSKMEKSDSGILGRRPVSAGPEHVANWWISYTATSGKLHGLGLGFGGNYGSENLITNSKATGVFTLPSYTVLNAGIFYQVNAYRLALKMDNITDKAYYGGWTTVERMMPRRFSASVAFKF
ncbi:TonB-dependent receptor [Chitinophaga oryzae]|uniref:TonB-dependent receptor n=1 Tax=Chitinophaga oryzae TaxID=2725414 RepID=A0AAE6ZG94_9BACT|nr:TonB-dependent receptor [Chitinophaga oryzae]QJB32248.1 TonB-dependent receptor [Chitinophaga oryzae]QJB38709.1 TonB-dependent receptor [Chitinophaga oryzae]